MINEESRNGNIGLLGLSFAPGLKQAFMNVHVLIPITKLMVNFLTPDFYREFWAGDKL